MHDPSRTPLAVQPERGGPGREGLAAPPGRAAPSPPPSTTPPAVRRAGAVAACLVAAWFGATPARAQVGFYVSSNPSGVSNHISHTALWFDYDGDGLRDLLLTTESGIPGQAGYPRSNRLYRVTLDGTGQPIFTDVSQASGIEDTNHASNGAVAADVNNDGNLDLYIANQFHTSFPNPPRNFLYLANGDGTFTESAASSGVEGGLHNMAVSAVDYDLDGWVDLFSGEVPQSGATNVPNLLYENLGTAQDGQVPLFQMQSAPVLDQTQEATYQAAWADYDLDGYPDVLLLNASDGATSTGIDVLAHNDAGAGFTEKTGAGFNDVALNGYGAWGDFDDDGDPDVFVTNWTDRGGGSPNAYGQLYRNDHPAGTFTNVTAALGLEVSFFQGAKQFTPAWLDWDNDGDLDLWIATDSSFGNLVFRNELHESGIATFTDVSLLSGAYDSVAQISSAVCDVDNDGWLDVMSSKEQFGLGWLGPRLHTNQIPWPTHTPLRLALEGSRSNRAGIGARVTLTLPDGRTPERTAGDQNGTFSGGEPIVHFGLATNAQADEVRVDWPSGIPQTLYDVPGGVAPLAVVEQGLRLVGTPVPGASLTIEIAGPAGDSYLLWTAVALVATPQPLPPFQGKVAMDLGQAIFLMQSGTIPSARFDTMALNLPNNPLLVGWKYYFQCLQGPFPPSNQLGWTDALTVTVQ